MMTQKIKLSPAMLFEVLREVADNLLSCPLESYAMMPASSLGPVGELRANAITLTTPEDTFKIAVACSKANARRLAAKMTQKPVDTLPPEMVQDALNEWLNILAGQIKSLGGLDHVMGLPSALNLDDQKVGADVLQAQGITITFGHKDAVLWLGLLGSATVILETEA